MSLDAEQIMENGVVVGTRNPTGDYLLIDCRFEMPYGTISPTVVFMRCCYNRKL